MNDPSADAVARRREQVRLNVAKLRLRRRSRQRGLETCKWRHKVPQDYYHASRNHITLQQPQCESTEPNPPEGQSLLSPKHYHVNSFAKPVELVYTHKSQGSDGLVESSPPIQGVKLNRSGTAPNYQAVVGQNAAPNGPWQTLTIHSLHKVAIKQHVDSYLLNSITEYSSALNILESGTDAQAIWMRELPRMTYRHEVVKDCMLGLAAARFALVKAFPSAERLTLYYRCHALSRLQRGLDCLSASNVDALLASTILLSWFQCDWSQWSSLMKGLNTMLSSMPCFKEQSCFFHFIEEETALPDMLKPSFSSAQSAMLQIEDLEAMESLQARLCTIAEHFSGSQSEQRLICQLISFLTRLQMKVPISCPAQQYNDSQFLRSAIPSASPSFLRKTREEPRAVAAALYFYSAVLITYPAFSAMGIMFFARLALPAIVDISNAVLERPCGFAPRCYAWEMAHESIDYAMEVVRRFRTRWGLAKTLL